MREGMRRQNWSFVMPFIHSGNKADCSEAHLDTPREASGSAKESRVLRTREDILCESRTSRQSILPRAQHSGSFSRNTVQLSTTIDCSNVFVGCSGL
jgi:hypothetical protein